MEYEVRVYPYLEEDGTKGWIAKFPKVKGCIGCGETPDEALQEAFENLEFHLEALKEENMSLPEEYEENKYNGRVALRIAKSTHKEVAELAEEEGVSINTFLNNAIECYIGKKEYNIEFDKKIDKLNEFLGQNKQFLDANIRLLMYKIINNPDSNKIWKKKF